MKCRQGTQLHTICPFVRRRKKMYSKYHIKYFSPWVIVTSHVVVAHFHSQTHTESHSFLCVFLNVNICYKKPCRRSGNHRRQSARGIPQGRRESFEDVCRYFNVFLMCCFDWSVNDAVSKPCVRDPDAVDQLYIHFVFGLSVPIASCIDVLFDLRFIWVRK